MPTFAELKAKAVKAKDAGVSKVQNVKDRNTSVPLKKTNWDPYSKQPTPQPPAPSISASTRPTNPFPPPPSHNRPSPTLTPPPNNVAVPPSRSPAPSLPTPSPAPRPTQTSRSSNGPPPVVRTTRPDLPGRAVETQAGPVIDWANLSAEDKEVFFGWLDEFFAKFLNTTRVPRDS